MSNTEVKNENKGGAESKDTAPSNYQRTFYLPFGYQDKEDGGKVHKRVVIGKRPVAKDFFFDTSNSNVQFDAMLHAASIVEFGDMKMPVPLTVLLSLNRIDREKIASEVMQYMGETIGKREAKILEPGKVKLAIGIKCDEQVYDVIKFGTLLTGYDEIEIEKTGATGWQKHLMTIAKEIVLLSHNQSGLERNNEVNIEEIENLDFFDLAILKEVEEAWLDSFRN